MDLVLFILAECEAEAFLAAHAVCLRALRRNPRLVGWRLRDASGGEGHSFP
ncbi:hypothetical protein PJ985_08485 [Streptomyces sp. ACA25]|uniref:hypothetical protein n=1 Tax=Streptomyces sp. ACA25 TaxID=3022596 RepID=UPI0023078F6B|nr:hypothetical protein [Streptomyces sp. ACA25]MDB1087602.1 hypothetical protein [Streptomyces sp. ACA25]